MDDYLNRIKRSQYVSSIDIFINFDDICWNMHRPWVETEAAMMGINARKHFAVGILNVMAHYRKWAYNNRIKMHVYGIYTSHYGSFKNAVYLPSYREHWIEDSRPDSTADRFRFINDTISKGFPIARTIADYVEDVYLIDSHYLEPSLVPYYLKRSGVAQGKWSLMVSRDMYDLQYAYLDNWIFVLPKGDNTQMISRQNLWEFVSAHEHIKTGGLRMGMYDHNLYPLALAINGDKRRSIPRLRKLGWKTLFTMLDSCVEKETTSIQIITSRFLDMVAEKGATASLVERNLACTNIASQFNVLTDIDKTSVTSQIKNVPDHEALESANTAFFSDYPINIPFLIAGSSSMGMYGGMGRGGRDRYVSGAKTQTKDGKFKKIDEDLR